MAEIHVHEGESRVIATMGDSIVVRLVEPGATGYQWTTEIIGSAVVEEFSSVQMPDGVEAAPGRSSDRTVGLRAVTPGTAEVRLALRRVWEDVEPIEQIRFRVDVMDDPGED